MQCGWGRGINRRHGRGYISAAKSQNTLTVHSFKQYRFFKKNPSVILPEVAW